MATKLWAIALVLFLTIINTAGQIFFKMAALRFELTLPGMLANWPLILGAMLYLISATLMIIAFRGGEISTLYPLIALSYVWVSLISPHFFPQDSMSTIKWAGVICIMGGVSLIGVGSQKK